MHWSVRPFILVAALVGMTAQALGAPAGWNLAGSKRSAYDAGIDKNVKRSGRASGFLKSKEPSIDGFGTLMQSIAPARYAGKRVRLSAVVKADKVADWAGLWLRIDGEASTPLAFDNMEGRAIRGSADWKSYEVVLDVASEAKGVAFGVLLAGTGALWIDDVKLEAVSLSVPVTGDAQKREAPENLDFEKE
jgi:hypothetical protein